MDDMDVDDRNDAEEVADVDEHECKRCGAHMTQRVDDAKDRDSDGTRDDDAEREIDWGLAAAAVKARLHHLAGVTFGAVKNSVGGMTLLARPLLYGAGALVGLVCADAILLSTEGGMSTLARAGFNVPYVGYDVCPGYFFASMGVFATLRVAAAGAERKRRRTLATLLRLASQPIALYLCAILADEVLTSHMPYGIWCMSPYWARDSNKFKYDIFTDGFNFGVLASTVTMAAAGTSVLLVHRALDPLLAVCRRGLLRLTDAERARRCGGDAH